MQISSHMAHLCAPNDRNGNPRRLYVGFFQDGENVKTCAWDEGYSGHHAVPEPYRVAAYGAERREISARTYRKLLKAYGQ